jgi:hypothetical protein
MMNNAALWWLLALGGPVWVPIVIYFAAKAGRSGWLRAEQLFFRHDRED